MAPVRKKDEGLLARVNFPLYTVQVLSDRHIIVGGGGGSSKTGVANGFEVFELSHDGKHFIAQEAFRHETGPKVVMNCACATVGKRTYLVAGQESHCQLYGVDMSISDPSKDNKKVNGEVENNLRKRKGSKISEETNEETNSHFKELKFSFKAHDSIQTDFGTDPCQRVVRISPCGKFLATGGTDGHVRLWKFPSLKPLHDVTSHSKEIDDIDFSSDSTLMVSVAKDGKAVTWSVKDGKKAHELQWSPPSETTKYLFKRCRFGIVEEDKSKCRIFTIVNSVGKPLDKSPSGFIQQWDGHSGKLCKSVPSDESLSALATRNDGRFIAVGTMFSGSVDIYIAFSLQKILNVHGAHGMFVTGLEFLPSRGNSVATVSEASVLSISVDNRICIHNVPYRRTIPPWMVILLIVITLFCTFTFCSYMGL